ncbi:KAP family P-loop NTPase fold protein [Microbacterium azadirachtae]|nr:P-loop NTPase fold protein [Microbacterium azadirachtae]
MIPGNAETLAPEGDGSPVRWLVDDPDPLTALSLGRRSFVESMWATVDRTKSVESSIVFGLVGPWGSGKSSILGWIKDHASASEISSPWSVVSFNPWDYSDPTSAQLGFFAELASAFGRHRGRKVRASIAKFGRALSPLLSVGSLLGLDPGRAVDGLANIIEGEQSVNRTRSQLIRELSALRRPVLVIIDDIDRISGDELLQTLKIVRQLGRLPYVHYLLSFDESTVFDAISGSSLVGNGGRSRAREYMDKVVQVRFDLPRIRPVDSLELLNRGLNEIGEATAFLLDERGTNRFSEAYGRFLTLRLDTPRAIRRFLTQVRMYAPMLAGEVDAADFLVLTWLRTAEPGVYAMLQAHRDSFVGSAERLLYVPTTTQGDERRKIRDEWSMRIRDAGTRGSDVDGVIEALSFLFPVFASKCGTEFRDDDVSFSSRVANSDYFDRYFSFGVLDDDISDVVVERALTVVASDPLAEGESVAQVRAALGFNPALTVDKITRVIAQKQLTAPNVYRWLTPVYIQLRRRQGVVSPDHTIERTVASRLAQMTSKQQTDALLAILEQGGAPLAVSALDRARGLGRYGGRTFSADETQLKPIRMAFASMLRASESTPLQMDQLTRSDAWSWLRVDPAGFADWIHDWSERIGDLDSIAFFVVSATSHGSYGTTVRLSSFDAETASTFFSLENVCAQHEEEIASADLVVNDPFDGLDDTPDNRRRTLLSALQQWRQKP